MFTLQTASHPGTGAYEACEQGSHDAGCVWSVMHMERASYLVGVVWHPGALWWCSHSFCVSKGGLEGGMHVCMDRVCWQKGLWWSCFRRVKVV